MLKRWASLCLLMWAASCSSAPNRPFLPQDASRVVKPFAASGYETLFSFGEAYGAGPAAPLLDVKGQLFGTTAGGGDWSTGGGTVFVVTTAGKETVLHSFGQGKDARAPLAGLVDLNGVLYGTTSEGGAYDQGTVFSIDATKQEHVLHSFGNGSDGIDPVGGLTLLNGTFYGTTDEGGAHNVGTVFSITASGHERVLYSFSDDNDGSHGYYPRAGLTLLNGVLYGTTANSDCGGTVFSISTAGTEKVIHDFHCYSEYVDGDGPLAGLLAVKGQLYGTTFESFGGTQSELGGTVFSLTTTGHEKILHYFGKTGDGSEPVAPVTLANGVLYGTTYSGGKYDRGTVFRLTLAGDESVLHSFGAPNDGVAPYAGLIDVGGVLYGTTAGGGKQHYGGGTVFKILP